MTALSPTITSRLAIDVYTLSKIPTLEAGIKELNRLHRGMFDFAESNMLSAKTGPVGIKISTAFGFVLVGKKEAGLNGHAVILFRGSQSLADWLTNFNITTSKTDSGHSVHDGFNQAFIGMKPQISKLLRSLKNVHIFHCIGHSLGGALATLCANWLKSQKKTAYLYSYGSPRVGLGSFAQHFTNNMKGKVFRVYHKTDPVPVLPTWPYVHVPETGIDYLLHSSGGFFSARYHSMKGEYCPKVKDHSWSSLPSLKDGPKSNSRIIRWLKSASRVVFSSNSILYLNDALMFVLKKAGYIVPKVITGSFSLLDGMAYVLKKGLSLVATVGKWILLFVKKLLEVLGMSSVVEASLLSKNYLRQLLMRLQQKVTIEAQKALRLGLA